MEQIERIIEQERKKGNYEKLIIELNGFCENEINKMKYYDCEKIKTNIMNKFDNCDFQCDDISINVDNLVDMDGHFKEHKCLIINKLEFTIIRSTDDMMPINT